MDLMPYVERLRQELAAAAEAGDAETRMLAERLTLPLESAARLALLSALSEAMDEVTRDLAPGSVDVRLRGVDPEFVVTLPGEPGGAVRGGRPGGAAGDAAGDAVMASSDFEEAGSPSGPGPAPDADAAGTSRINLRLPGALKGRAEEAAAREGVSLNAWLVRTVTAALEPSGPARGPRHPRHGQSFTGWVR